MVGRPQATDIERDVQEVKRFLRELAHSNILMEEWSLPRILAVCQFLINDDPEELLNISPSQLTFGRRDPQMYQIIQDADPTGTAAEHATAYHQRLLKELHEINSLYSKHKAERALESTASNLLACYETSYTNPSSYRNTASLPVLCTFLYIGG